MYRNHKKRLLIEVELMNPEDAWDSEVIPNGAKIVGCNGSTSHDVTPKGNM